jgi:hypothetical protein
MPDFQIANRALEEMIDFLVSGPTPAQIIAFKVSATAQARLDELLDKNREEGLSDAETAELDAFAQVNHVLLLIKARARNLIDRPSPINSSITL